jgi:hypothetical protein
MPTSSKNKNPPVSVDSFLATLQHERKNEIVELRAILLGISPSISEEIKWNAPSFRTKEHFATMHLRSKDALQLILHMGAGKRSMPATAIDDPSGLLKWLGPDRALIRFTDSKDLAAKTPALEALVRQWIRHV